MEEFNEQNRIEDVKEKNSKNRLIIIVLLAVLIIAAVLAIYFCFIDKENKKESDITNTTTITAKEEPKSNGWIDDVQDLIEVTENEIGEGYYTLKMETTNKKLNIQVIRYYEDDDGEREELDLEEEIDNIKVIKRGFIERFDGIKKDIYFFINESNELWYLELEEENESYFTKAKSKYVDAKSTSLFPYLFLVDAKGDYYSYDEEKILDKDVYYIVEYSNIVIKNNKDIYVNNKKMDFKYYGSVIDYQDGNFIYLIGEDDYLYYDEMDRLSKVKDSKIKKIEEGEGGIKIIFENGEEITEGAYVLK